MIPSRPCSLKESASIVKNGVERSTPFSITRIVPLCSQTSMRPSGSNAMRVTLVMPVATCVTVKPSGTSAAAAGSCNKRQTSEEERWKGVRIDLGFIAGHDFVYLDLVSLVQKRAAIGEPFTEKSPEELHLELLLEFETRFIRQTMF